MDAEGILYHLGWIVGVGWLAMAVGQVVVGLEGMAISDVSGWGLYAWLGVVQFGLGVGWLVWWYVSIRGQIRDGVGG